MTLKILSGKYKNQILQTPKNIRPITSNIREAIFNICQNYIEDASFLDIFSGSGIIGLEALSRNAKFSTFIDKSFLSCKIIKKNIQKLRVENSSIVIVSDAIKAIDRLSGTFDIITIDPPFIFYKEKPDYINDLLSKIVDKKILKKESVIFLEQPTYAKREEKIQGLILKNKRRYSSAYLFEYLLDT